MATTQTQPRDAMQFVNEQDDATLERFVERLELRGKDPTFVGYREAYLKLIGRPAPPPYWRSAAAPASYARARRHDAFACRVTASSRAPSSSRSPSRRGRNSVGERIEFAVGETHARLRRRQLLRRHRPHSRQPCHRPARRGRRSRALVARAAPSPPSTAITHPGPSPTPTPLAQAMEPAVQSTIMSYPRVMRAPPACCPGLGFD